MLETQPSKEQELANAAYVWRRKLQADVIDVLRDGNLKLDTAEWWFERLLNAYRHEIETDHAAKAARGL